MAGVSMDAGEAPEGDMYRVVVLEDGRYSMAGILAELGGLSDIEVVGATAEPGELIALIERFRPHVAIIDLKISGDGLVGISVMSEIKSRFPDVKCVVLTAFPDPSSLLAAMDAGVEGFLLKDAPPRIQPPLDEMVRIVVKGDKYYDTETATLVREYVDRSRLRSACESGLDSKDTNHLTERELEVLEQVSLGLRYAQIAKELNITRHTVKSHMANIYTKLGARGAQHAVLIARAKGLIV